MLNATPAAAAAIVAPTRRMHARAALNVLDPDIIYGVNTSSAIAPFGNLAQLTNSNVDSAFFATPELNHWPLTGEVVVPELVPSDDEVGFPSLLVGDADGVMSGVYAQVNVTNLDVLSVMSLDFSPHDLDGYAIDFDVEIYSGLTLAHRAQVRDNVFTRVILSDFIAYNVTAIRVVPLRWSRPYTRARIIEVTAGLYEPWEGSALKQLSTYNEVDYSMMTLPFGSAIIEVNNFDRRLDPNSRTGLFAMIESRQQIPIDYGPQLDDGAIEWIPSGVYYMQNKGWESVLGGLIIRFKLVDIIGLLRDRQYRMPEVLPTTLIGWVTSIVSQLGAVFANRFHVDETLADTELIATSDNVRTIKNGDLLRYACMAAGAVCYADAATGHLIVAPMPNTTGAELTRSNLKPHPTQRANDDIASITFQLNDGSNTQFVVNGTNSSAETTLSVNNFFIKTQLLAQLVARRIVGTYGGQIVESIGRGDVRSELGDLESIEVARDTFVGGRLTRRQIKYDDLGTIRDVQTTHVQPTGEKIYSNTVVLTVNQYWTAPDGVYEIRVSLGSGGQGGEGGEAGGTDYFQSGSGRGAGGTFGYSGLVWTGTIQINAGQTFSVQIGRGGEGGLPVAYGQPRNPGAFGTPTYLVPYSSADGIQHNGLVILGSGVVLSSNGVAGQGAASIVIPGAPGANGTGNGGGGGSGGQPLRWVSQSGSDSLIELDRVPGAPGGRGGDGYAIISYDLPET